MASPYMGLAGSLARARKPPAQNDVYMQQPRGVPAYAQQNRNNYTASATAPYAQASKPRDAYWYAPLPGGGMPGGVPGMAPPSGGMTFGGGPTPMPGGGGPAFGGGPTMGGNMDPNTSRLARPNVPGFGGGPQPGPKPMMLPPNPYGGPKP